MARATSLYPYQTSSQPAAFKPSDVSGCVLWLRADLGITLVGSKVSVWADQSGNSNSVTQGTDGLRPTYNSADSTYAGTPSLSFDGVGTMLNGPTFSPVLTQPFSIFVVGENVSNGGLQACVCDNPAGFFYYGSHATTKFWEFSGGSAVVTSVDSTSAAAVTACIANGATSKFFVNNSQTASASGDDGSGIPPTIGIGGGDAAGVPWGGTIAEVVVLTGSPSAAVMRQMFQYFGSRTGLLVS